MLTVNRTVLTILLIGLVYLAGHINGCACNRAAQKPSPKQDTTILHHRDTIIWRDVDTVTQYIPQPTFVYVPRVDSFISFQNVPIYVRDTVQILGDYFTKRFYSDPIPSRYGLITVNDTVTQNRITSRDVTFDFSIPSTIEYRSLPKRNQMWVGIQSFYQPYTGQIAVGGSLEFLHKRGIGLEVFGNVNTRGVGEVGVGGKYLIQVKKP
jgi:hypothetical protein